METRSGLTLYHASPSRSSTVLWMLEELGEPFDVHLLELKKGEQKSPAHLAVNPMGKVPALADGDVIVTEAAAICCYLADTYPKNHLAPPVGDLRRGAYLTWLFYGPSCIEPAIIDKALKRDPGPSATVGYGSYEQVVDVVAAAVSRNPYILGDQFTAADVVIGSGLRWGMLFKLLPERAEFVAYAKRLEQRPALQRQIAKDQEFARQGAG